MANILQLYKTKDLLNMLKKIPDLDKFKIGLRKAEYLKSFEN